MAVLAYAVDRRADRAILYLRLSKSVWLCSFAFPAIKPPQPIMLRSVQPMQQALGEDLSKGIAESCNQWLSSGGGRPLFWLLRITEDNSVESVPLSSWQEVSCCRHLRQLRCPNIAH